MLVVAFVNSCKTRDSVAGRMRISNNKIVIGVTLTILLAGSLFQREFNFRTQSLSTVNSHVSTHYIHILGSFSPRGNASLK